MIERNRFYVKLGASQVRRRLKGHGYGVTKIETAGKGRASITHTATGRHREELHSLFSDVIDVPPDDGEAVSATPGSRSDQIE